MSDLKQRMEGALGALKKEFSGLRTGRASADLVAPVQVDAYGGSVPLNQVANVNATDARTLSIQVWDGSVVSAVEKAIMNAGLGLNPHTEGTVIRINLPELNEERRQDLVKVARKYAEAARIAIRNVRRDGMDEIKKQEKEGGMSEDESRALGEDVQKTTDSFIQQIDEMLNAKEKDIMSV